MPAADPHILELVEDVGVQRAVETVVDSEFDPVAVAVVVYLVAAVVVAAEYSAGAVGFLAVVVAQVELVVASHTGYQADYIVVPLVLDEFVVEESVVHAVGLQLVGHLDVVAFAGPAEFLVVE